MENDDLDNNYFNLLNDDNLNGWPDDNLFDPLNDLDESGSSPSFPTFSTPGGEGGVSTTTDPFEINADTDMLDVFGDFPSPLNSSEEKQDPPLDTDLHQSLSTNERRQLAEMMVIDDDPPPAFDEPLTTARTFSAPTDDDPVSNALRNIRMTLPMPKAWKNTFKDETDKTKKRVSGLRGRPPPPKSLKRGRTDDNDNEGIDTTIVQNPSLPNQLDRASLIIRREVNNINTHERWLQQQSSRALTMDEYAVIVVTFIDALQSRLPNVTNAFKKAVAHAGIGDPHIWKYVAQALSDSTGNYEALMKFSSMSSTFYNLVNSDVFWSYILLRELSWEEETIMRPDPGMLHDGSTVIGRSHETMFIHADHYTAFVRLASAATVNAPSMAITVQGSVAEEQLSVKTIPTWRVLKRLVEMRWRIRKGFHASATPQHNANIRRRMYGLKGGNGHGSMPTIVSAPGSPWLFSVSSHDVIMWQPGVPPHLLSMKMRFDLDFLGNKEKPTTLTRWSSLLSRPVIVPLTLGFTLLMGNFIIDANCAAMNQWWVHMFQLARGMGPLHERAFGMIFGNIYNLDKRRNLSVLHTSACLLPTLQLAKMYETRLNVLNSVTSPEANATLVETFNTQAPYRIPMVYLYDRAIIELCALAANDKTWFGPSGPTYLWGVTDPDRLDPYAHQHIAYHHTGVVATVTPSLLLMAYVIPQPVVTATTGPLVSGMLIDTASVQVTNQRAWPLFELVHRILGRTNAKDADCIIVGVTLDIQDALAQVVDRRCLTVVMRMALPQIPGVINNNEGDGAATHLVFITWLVSDLLAPTTSLSTLVQRVNVKTQLMTDDRMAIVKNRRYASSHGFAIVPENVESHNWPMNIDAVTKIPALSTMQHLVYVGLTKKVPIDPRSSEGRPFLVPRLTMQEQPPTPKQWPFFDNDESIQKLYKDLPRDPRHRPYTALLQTMNAATMARSSPKRTNLGQVARHLMTQLWVARDGVNWRTRWVSMEYGLLLFIHLEGHHLTVHTVPHNVTDKIRTLRMKVSAIKNAAHVERAAITNVHDGVVIIEFYTLGPKKTLIWQAVIIRFASFHPIFKYAHIAAEEPNKRATEAYHVPSWPLVSRPLDASHSLAFEDETTITTSVTDHIDETLALMSKWTLS
jgi:hypothetical protein